MKKTLSLLSAALISVSAIAQDSTAVKDVVQTAPVKEVPEKTFPLEISGSVDAYFRANIDAPQERGGAGALAPNTSFANKTGFALGMANLILQKDGDKAGFTADLVFGPRGTDAVFGSAPGFGSAEMVNQLFGYLNVNDRLTLTLGNFNTFLGYEVISPAANFNYSTSYMFSYGPFSHTGLKADIALTDNVSAMLAVLNPTDMTEMNSVGSYSFGAQLGYENDNGGAWLNFLHGDQDGAPVGNSFNASPAMTQIDLTTGWNLSDDFYLGFNTTANYMPTDTLIGGTGADSLDGASGPTANFAGAALYLQYTISDNFSLGFRSEYFEEVNGGAGAIGMYNGNGTGQVLDLTLSANIKAGSLTIIPEIRTDFTNQDSFLTPNYSATDGLTSFLVAAVYAF